MAKKDQNVEESTVVEAPKAKVINLVTMNDGSQKNFGERNKLLSDSSTTETGFSIVFHVSNGEQVVYDFSGDTSLLLEMAAFGAASKIKQAVTGEKDVNKLAALIKDKIEEFHQGSFVNRVTGQLTTSLSQIQVAYARVHGIDITTTEGVAKVNAIFAAMTKEDKSALAQQGKIKLEIAKLRLEAAEAALVD